MKAAKFFIVIFFLLAGFANKSFAQKTEALPLDSFLIYLENRFDVVFTYADVNVEGKKVLITEDDLGLNEYLRKLEAQTGLIFQRVNSRYIAIQKSILEIRLSGTIKDKSTGEKLTGATVYSEENHTISDENGFFSIVLNREEDSLLIIRHVGYEPLHLNQDAWKSDTSVYEMAPDIQVLEEVELNYISRGILKLPDGSIQLNVQNLELLPGLTEPDVLHVVQVLPGIQSINETVSDINTRGGTNDQSLVLWDGIKMYQSGHFFGLISAFNSHLIYNTTIIKNGTSAFYDEGVSGTIDMHLQDNTVKDFEISTGINMLSTDIIAKIPLAEKFSLILSARHSINDIIETPTYKSYFKRAFEHTEVMLTQPGTDTAVDISQDFSFYDISAKLLYDVSKKDKIRWSVLNNRNRIEYEESAIILDSLYTRESLLRQSNLLSKLSYSRSWSENHTTKLSAFFSGYLLEGSNVSLMDNQNHLQENEVIDWGLKLESKNRINRKISLSSGYHFKEVGIRNLDNIRKPNYIRDVKDVLRIHSLYTETEFKRLAGKLYLRTGLRANYFPEFNRFLFEPRIALNYDLTRHLSLEALAEMKSQYTTQQVDYQTDFLGIEKRRWVLSNNESIPLLKSQQVSAGIQYNPNNFLVSLEAYMKKVEGIITPSQGFQNQFQYIYSTGEYDAHGIELLLNKRFKRSTTWFTYTLAENDYYFEEFTPSVFPNNLDIRHALSLGGNFNIKDFEFSAGFNYRSGMPYTEPAQDNLNEFNEIVYKEPNSSRLKDYARADVSAKYNFEIKSVKAELGISVWNILNRDNFYNVFYQVNEDLEIEKITRKTLGITPNVSIRLRFE